MSKCEVGNPCLYCKHDFEPQEMDDIISRILERMWNCRGKHTTSIDKVKMEQIIRENLPSVTPKQRMGHWVRITNGAMKEKYICSECGRQIENDGIESLLPIRYPYCHCGAKMESEDPV